MGITKAFAFSNFKTLQTENPRLFQDLLREFNDMSKGGKGGPYRLCYVWTTVRMHYYPDWSDQDFRDVLNDLENYRKSIKIDL